MPVGVVLSLDYEIHGNGEGSPLELMVEPTRRLLSQLERFGAKLTIFAETAEILRFREHLEATGRDDFHYEAIVEQLRYATARGHDVQLHIHPSYLNATLRPSGWKQDWNEYDTAQLPLPRARAVVAQTKSFLEDVLGPADPTYRVYAFRAGNWAMMPTRNIARALIEQGIEIESSVFKGGKRDGLARFDYASAHSDALPWRLDVDNVCHEDPASPLWEYPIYCEMRLLTAFLSANRFYRVCLDRAHRLADVPTPSKGGNSRGASGSLAGVAKLAQAVFGRYPWKADFNQCSARQLTHALKRLSLRHERSVELVPFVTIGHSKLYTRYNERNFEEFLKFVSGQPARYRYCLYRDFLQDEAR